MPNNPGLLTIDTGTVTVCPALAETLPTTNVGFVILVYCAVTIILLVTFVNVLSHLENT